MQYFEFEKSLMSAGVSAGAAAAVFSGGIAFATRGRDALGCGTAGATGLTGTGAAGAGATGAVLSGASPAMHIATGKTKHKTRAITIDRSSFQQDRLDPSPATF